MTFMLPLEWAVEGALRSTSLSYCFVFKAAPPLGHTQASTLIPEDGGQGSYESLFPGLYMLLF